MARGARRTVPDFVFRSAAGVRLRRQRQFLVMTWLGLDIGGANLKAADGRGWAHSVPFALWRDPDGLAGALSELAATAPGSERWAVTMTGELCDCFRTKADGVRHILAAVEMAAGPRDVVVYLVDGRLVSVDEAR